MIPERPAAGVKVLLATPLGEVPARQLTPSHFLPALFDLQDIHAPLLDPKVKVRAARLAHPMTSPEVSPTLPTSAQAQTRKSTVIQVTQQGTRCQVPISQAHQSVQRIISDPFVASH